MPRTLLPSWVRLTTIVGILGWLMALAAWGFLWTLDPRQAAAIAIAVATFYYAGKLGGIAVGIAAGGSPVLVGAAMLLVDIAGLLAFFPLTQHGVDWLARRQGLLARWLQGQQERAQENTRLVDRWGALGLFLFSIIPVAFHGPLVSAVVGRITGLSPARTLATLLASVTFVAVTWTTVFALGFNKVAKIDERLAIGAAALILIATLLVPFAASRRRRPRKPAANV